MVSMTRFDLCGGHLALDLVNSLDNRFREDGPDEMLTSYSDLLRFLEQSAQISRQHTRLLIHVSGTRAAARTLQSARKLREATATVLYGLIRGEPPAPAYKGVFEEYFIDACRHRELRWQDKQGVFTWQWDRFEAQAELPMWILSQAVSDLLLSNELGRVRACFADTCRWLFLDRSKNSMRRWCNMKVCGNRMKARRFQAHRNSR